MNSKKYSLLAIPLFAILGSVLLFTGVADDKGDTIELNVFDGLGLFLAGILPHEQNPGQTSGLLFTGAYDMIVRGPDGQIKSHTHEDNLVVDIGLKTVADQMFPNIDLNGSTQAQFSYLKIGTGSTAPAGANTDIETAIGGCSAVQDTLVEGSFAANTATIVVDASFSGASCAATVQEAVLANAATGGQILSRVLTGATVVGAGDTLDLTYTFTLKDDGI